MFYVSPLNWKGREAFRDQHSSSWNQHLILENEKFENFVFVNLDLRFLFKQMVFIWDGNHKFQTWLPHINYVHNDEPSWHIFVDSIIQDTSF